jgi:RNA polymerase sigma-70 factor (ECF subfamily)
VAQRRDREAFAGLFHWFAPRVKRYMQRLGVDPELAEDLAQETLVQIWRKAGQYDPCKAAPSTWVFTVARNLRIDRIRRQRLFEVELTDEADAEDEREDSHQRMLERLDSGRLAALLAGLPADQMEVIRLAYFEGLSHAEVGKALDVPLGTVKSRLRLALARLRKAMGKES